LFPEPCPSADVSACGPSVAALGALARAAGASILFVAVWVAALALVGGASALRSTLWTLAVGARRPETAVVAWPVDAHA
jgi:hypothetical protein